MYKCRLSDFREKNNITQSELAVFLGVTSDYISMIECGRRTPGFILSKKIADYFSASIDDIFFAQESNVLFDREE